MLDIVEKLREKLRAEMDKRVRSERQVVYMMVVIRKLLELTAPPNYFALNFYCSWALHPLMKRAGARRIISRFEEVYSIVTSRGRDAVSPELHKAVGDTIGAVKLKQEMDRFITEHKLPKRLTTPEGWLEFLHYYADN